MQKLEKTWSRTSSGVTSPTRSSRLLNASRKSAAASSSPESAARASPALSTPSLVVLGADELNILVRAHQEARGLPSQRPRPPVRPGQVPHGGAQPPEPCPIQRADQQRSRIVRSEKIFRRSIQQIHLVENQQLNLRIERLEGIDAPGGIPGSIYNPADSIRMLQLQAGQPLYGPPGLGTHVPVKPRRLASLLSRVAPGEVHPGHIDPVFGARPAHRITGGSRKLGNKRLPTAEDGIEKTRLPRVGVARQHAMKGARGGHSQRR